MNKRNIALIAISMTMLVSAGKGGGTACMRSESITAGIAYPCDEGGERGGFMLAAMLAAGGLIGLGRAASGQGAHS